MSKRNSGMGPIPERWLNCPRRGIRLVHNKFLAFKTPLSQDFDDQVSEACRFNVDFIFTMVKAQKWKMGLWIDLTNTSRFYNKADVESHNCKYLKLPCRGHGETPSKEQTRAFVGVCQQFISQNPLEIIGVHCTHGFNRTGFLITSYLVDAEDNSLDAALAEFAIARPPGIYKGDYIEELFNRYEEGETPPAPPARPGWCLEYDDSNDNDHEDAAPDEYNDDDVDDDDDDDDDDDGDNDYNNHSGTSDQPQAKRRKTEFKHKNPVFMAGVPGVTPLTDGPKISGIQRRVQKICGWKSSGFPGSQPVSMDRSNIRFLHEKPYRVSWKADGTRYMLLIQGDGELFFIDRDNSVFKINNIKFPHVNDKKRTLRDTLLDGEMVIDRVNGKEYPRYLAYDIIMYDSKDVSKLAYYPDRYSIIRDEVIKGRLLALQERRLIREREPFSVRLKEFWPVTQAGSLVSDKFAQQLSHEPDGLIFQPSKEPYCPGTAQDVLKWKPLSLNSVDFKLKIVTEGGVGIISKKVGYLYVGGKNDPFSRMPSIKNIKEYDNKIIECKFEDGKWVFMRERTDKSFPNSYKTAMSVCESIRDPVTTEFLLDFIYRNRFVDDSDLMPPPTTAT